MVFMVEVKKVIIVSGGFDPLHEGHISLFKSASEFRGDFNKIIVLLNSDEWLTRKKGKNFQSLYTRKTIIENLYMVGNVIDFDDSDDTAINGISKVLELYKNQNCEFYFCNGGDRQKTNTPEDEYCLKNNVKSVYGIGGEEKQNSSSTILKKWTDNVLKIFKK